MKLLTLLVAQNLGEYGSLGGAVANGVSHLRFIIENQLRNMTPLTWAMVIVAFVVLRLVFRVRR